MTVEDITLLAGVYFIGAVIISLLAAFWLDLRLKSLLPTNGPYLWGFFFGSICFLACFPLAALSALEAIRAALSGKWAACSVHEVSTLVFAANALCGWFILRRKRWAWALGTFLGPISAFPALRDLLGPDPVFLSFLGCIIWPVNYVYGRNRWTEFRIQASAPATADNKPFEPVRLLTSLEAKAQLQDLPPLSRESTTQPPEHLPALPMLESVGAEAEHDTAQPELASVSGPQADIGRAD